MRAAVPPPINRGRSCASLATKSSVAGSHLSPRHGGHRQRHLLSRYITATDYLTDQVKTKLWGDEAYPEDNYVLALAETTEKWPARTCCKWNPRPRRKSAPCGSSNCKFKIERNVVRNSQSIRFCLAEPGQLLHQCPTFRPMKLHLGAKEKAAREQPFLFLVTRQSVAHIDHSDSQIQGTMGKEMPVGRTPRIRFRFAPRSKCFGRNEMRSAKATYRNLNTNSRVIKLVHSAL